MADQLVVPLVVQRVHTLAGKVMEVINAVHRQKLRVQNQIAEEAPVKYPRQVTARKLEAEACRLLPFLLQLRRAL